MRILDPEHAKILKENEKKDKKQIQTKVVKKAPKWQKQSEEFRAAIKNTGDGPSSVPVKLNYDDYTHCQYCNKKYNQQAYEKHLNFCMKKAKESTMKPKPNVSNLKPNLNVKFKK